VCSTRFWYDPEKKSSFTNFTRFKELKRLAQDANNDQYFFIPPLDQPL
jgi:hypothetical protein